MRASVCVCLFACVCVCVCVYANMCTCICVCAYAYISAPDNVCLHLADVQMTLDTRDVQWRCPAARADIDHCVAIADKPFHNFSLRDARVLKDESSDKEVCLNEIDQQNKLYLKKSA